MVGVVEIEMMRCEFEMRTIREVIKLNVDVCLVLLGYRDVTRDLM